MKEKLPVVGKKYKIKGGHIVFQIRFIEMGITLDDGYDTSSHISLEDLNDFLSKLEEVSEDKPTDEDDYVALGLKNVKEIK